MKEEKILLEMKSAWNLTRLFSGIAVCIGLLNLFLNFNLLIFPALISLGVSVWFCSKLFTLGDIIFDEDDLEVNK